MRVELHLPDLPEVPIALGPARGHAVPLVRLPWHLRLRELLVAFLPVLLMFLLALASWWLVKNSPKPVAPVEDRPARTEPDYEMTGFALERFGADGRMLLRIEGERLRHFPATDRIEIEGARIRAIAPDGRITLATASRALAAGDGSEVQLLGGAEVDSVDARGVSLTMDGEFLHLFLAAEKLRSHLPVQVRHGSTVLTAAGLDYDHATQRLDLKGPTRAVLAPRASRPGKAP